MENEEDSLEKIGECYQEWSLVYGQGVTGIKSSGSRRKVYYTAVATGGN